MKKIFTLIAVALSALSINAQTVELLNLATSPAEAEAAGLKKMWDTYDWGAAVPAGQLFANDNVKLSLEAEAYLGYGDGYVKKAGKNNYKFALCMSSSNLSNFYTDPILDPSAFTNTSNGKQGGALCLEPAVDGKITMFYSTGLNNRSMFVYDATETLNDGLGALILANNIEQGGDKGDNMKAEGVKDKVHTPSFDVVAGHKYYIIASGTQTELYSIQFTSFKDNEAYVPAIADAQVHGTFLLNLATSPAEAEAAGLKKMWDTYDWGAAVPVGQLFANDNVKLSLEAEAYLGYGDGYVKKAGKNDYKFALCMSSSNLSNFYTDPILDPSAFTNTSNGKQGGALCLEPAVDGKITMFYSTGLNNRSMFVYDATETLNDGLGALILANNIEQGGDKGDNMKAEGVKDKVHAPSFDVVAGHKYYIIASGTQTELYQIAFASFKEEIYNGTTGIEDITTIVPAVKENNNIYSIDGRFVGTEKASLKSGLYIMNGKKVVVK